MAACAGSSLLSLRRSIPRPLSAAAGPGSMAFVRVPVLVWFWLERSLGEGALGRGVRRFAGAVEGSSLLEGEWTRVLGALVGATAVARMWRSGLEPLDLVGLILVVVAGVAALVFGPGLVRASGWSVTGRLLGARPAAPRPRARSGRAGVLMVVGMVALAAAAGVLAGSASGWAGIAGLAAGLLVCVGVFALYRPEILLLVLAAFPWVNWLVRKALAGTPLAGASDDLLLVGSLVALLFCVLIVRRWELRTVPILAPLLVAVTAALGSICLNYVPSDVGVFALRVTFEPLLFYFLGLWLPKDVRWVKVAVGVFLATAVALALHGIYQYLTHAPMPARWVDAREVTLYTRAYSIVENPNGLGGFLVMGACVSIAMALGRVSARLRIVSVAVSVVLLIGLALTFSRGAWLGLVAGVVAMMALGRPRLLGVLALLGAASPLLLPRSIIDRVTFALTSDYLGKSAINGRLYVWGIGLYRIAEHPWFGIGLGTFGGTSAFLFGYGRLWMDNFYLQMAAEGGLILLAAFLWLLCRAGKGLVAGHRSAEDPFLRALTVGAFGSFIAVVVANLTAGVWETLVVGAGFWFLVGLAGALPAGEAEGSRLIRMRDLTAEPPLRNGADALAEPASAGLSAGDTA